MLGFNGNRLVGEELSPEELRESLKELASKNRPLVKTMVQNDRLSVLLTIYHEQHGEQPTQQQIATSRELRAKDVQIYERKYKLPSGHDPEMLDTGWIVTPGLILIRNRTGENPQVNPTEEEKQKIKETILVLHIGENAIEIPPGLFFCGIIAAPEETTLECVNHEASVSITVYPSF